MSGMFSIQKDGSLIELREEPYNNEGIFQRMLADYPSLLPGDQFNQESPRRWLLISREAGIPCEEAGGNRWSVDHLFFDQDAIPTLVEVKRSSDTRIRREVVGQVLEYAANAVNYWPIETIRAKFEAHCEAQSKNPEQELAEFLGGLDGEEFWEKARTNLLAGRVRLVFVADVIGKELKRIVEFLNEQMNPAEVLAVEIRQFVGAGIQTLVPRVIGLTAQAEQKNASNASRLYRKWTEEDVLELLRTRNPDEAETAERLMRWAKDNDLYAISGLGNKIGAIYYSSDGNRKDVFGIGTSGSLGFIPTNFRPPFNQFEKKSELLSRLGAINGAGIGEGDVKRTYLGIPLSLLTDEVSYAKLIDAMSLYITEVQNN